MAGQVAKAGFDLAVHDLRRDVAAPLLNEGRGVDRFAQRRGGALGYRMHLRAGPRGDGAGPEAGRQPVLKTALKDITPATELAEEVGVQVQLAEACRAEMNEALERGLGGLDSSVALTLQEERAGVQVRLVNRNL